MKALAFAVLLLAAAAAAQDLLSPAAGKDDRAVPAPAPYLRDPAIDKAVREIVAEDRPARPATGGAALRGDPAHDAFARKIDEATVPGCLHPDALKHAPPQLGPVTLGGILALPFLAGAVLSGKCR